MIEIKDCSFSYKRKGDLTIDHFSLNLMEGGIYGLLGSNGAGKSTLLQLIAGLLTPISGDVELNGINTRLRRPATSREIYIVPEEIFLPDMKLNDYARLHGKFYPNYSEENLIRNLEILELDRNINLKNLSMGQKKKAALAFAMACNTKVLLMDEPTNGLDIPAKSAFRKFVIESMRDDRIFVISTHQVRDVSQILDHILIMDNRRMLLDRSVAEIQERLRFTETVDPMLMEKAIYSVKGLGGASVILPNDDDSDSELNIELLFNFAHDNPQKLNSVFEQ